MGGPSIAARGKRAHALRGAMSAVTLVVAGLCTGWVLSSAAHRSVLDLPRRPATAAARRPLAPPPRGVLVDTVFAQRLSHRAFHADDAKRALAALVGARDGARGAVAVVGVEWGAEVEMFAKLGYVVHAFEPVKKFHDSIQRRIADNARRADAGDGNRWDVRLHKIAAGDQRGGNLSVTYHTEATRITETVRRGRIDDYIHGELVVLSVDIQGNELDVLKGATRLLSRDVGVRSLWIEIFPCNRKVLDIFRLLDRDYVIFDFVPWGRPMMNGKPAARTMSLSEHESFVAEDGRTRPAEFGTFFNWMCKKRRHFQWMQSDVLAVRRDLVTPEFLTKLGTLANDLFLQSIDAAKAPV